MSSPSSLGSNGRTRTHERTNSAARRWHVNSRLMGLLGVASRKPGRVFARTGCGSRLPAVGHVTEVRAVSEVGALSTGRCDVIGFLRNIIIEGLALRGFFGGRPARRITAGHCLGPRTGHRRRRRRLPRLPNGNDSHFCPGGAHAAQGRAAAGAGSSRKRRMRRRQAASGSPRVHQRAHPLRPARQDRAERQRHHDRHGEAQPRRHLRPAAHEVVLEAEAAVEARVDPLQRAAAVVAPLPRRAAPRRRREHPPVARRQGPRAPPARSRRPSSRRRAGTPPGPRSPARTPPPGSGTSARPGPPRSPGTPSAAPRPSPGTGRTPRPSRCAARCRRPSAARERSTGRAGSYPGSAFSSRHSSRTSTSGRTPYTFPQLPLQRPAVQPPVGAEVRAPLRQRRLRFEQRVHPRRHGEPHRDLVLHVRDHVQAVAEPRLHLRPRPARLPVDAARLVLPPVRVRVRRPPRRRLTPPRRTARHRLAVVAEVPAEPRQLLQQPAAQRVRHPRHRAGLPLQLHDVAQELRERPRRRHPVPPRTRLLDHLRPAVRPPRQRPLSAAPAGPAGRTRTPRAAPGCAPAPAAATPTRRARTPPPPPAPATSPTPGLVPAPAALRLQRGHHRPVRQVVQHEPQVSTEQLQSVTFLTFKTYTHADPTP